MKVAIIGYGNQGRAAYDYWHDGNEITICDKGENVVLPVGVEAQLGEKYLINLERFDLVVRSPSVHPRYIVAANSPDVLKKVTTVTNEFFRISPSKNIIGVTGTKGKGTTSTLITKMLEADGKTVHLGGNIGTPPLDLLKKGIKPSDWIVLELANFQLIDLNTSPPIAVCLAVVPEHLDWHSDMAEYTQAKVQLFRFQKVGDIAVYYAHNVTSKQIAAASKGRKIPYFAPPGAIVSNGSFIIKDLEICKTSELKLLGEHNWQNVCAAVTAVWQIRQNVESLRRVLTSFSGLPFRIELRRKVKGVRYYNDSFASAPSASIAAFSAVPGPKVMILGGYDRGLDLSELPKAFMAKPKEIRKVLLIGATGERTAAALEEKGFNNYVINKAKKMTDIVREASRLAQDGDAVILSPGFASFDMFRNFEDRGQKFNAAVEAL